MKRLSSALALSTLLLTPAAASAAAQKLLLTEVVVAVTQAEYVAIFNPGTTAIDLSNYYLADFESYYKVATATPTSAGTTDFMVRFPTGAVIQPGQTQYVSIGGAECFKTACNPAVGSAYLGFGVYPSYEVPLPPLAADASAAVPDMIAPFTGAIGSSRSLTNGGEMVILFYWDGASNLVTDVDYVYYGTFGTTNLEVDKTGVMTYLPDTPDATHVRHAPVSPSGTGIATSGSCACQPPTSQELRTAACRVRREIVGAA
jgi:hypothetical protein